MSVWVGKDKDCGTCRRGYRADGGWFSACPCRAADGVRLLAVVFTLALRTENIKIQVDDVPIPIAVLIRWSCAVDAILAANVHGGLLGHCCASQANQGGRFTSRGIVLEVEREVGGLHSSYVNTCHKLLMFVLDRLVFVGVRVVISW